MRRVIEILKREHEISSKFQDQDTWYLSYLRGRKNEEKGVEALERRLKERGETLAEVEDAIEVLENHSG